MPISPRTRLEMEQALATLQPKQDSNKLATDKKDAFDFRSQYILLSIALSAAVPLWIHEWYNHSERNGVDWDTMQRRAHECADIVAEKGDLLMFRGSKKGESARVFNALAEGLSIMSFCPGGVRALDNHWETKHPSDITGV